MAGPCARPCCWCYQVNNDESSHYPARWYTRSAIGSDNFAHDCCQALERAGTAAQGQRCYMLAACAPLHVPAPGLWCRSDRRCPRIALKAVRGHLGVQNPSMNRLQLVASASEGLSGLGRLTVCAKVTSDRPALHRPVFKDWACCFPGIKRFQTEFRVCIRRSWRARKIASDWQVTAPRLSVAPRQLSARHDAGQQNQRSSRQHQQKLVSVQYENRSM